MFTVEIGEKGLNNSWQAPFEKITECDCGGEARIAFVASEHPSEEEKGKPMAEAVPNLHENKPGEMWPHDCIAVAVYFCKECLKPVAKFNQG